jgi:serine/threonine-protein kinase
MSPEQATGSRFDHRSDLYAVGVVLYQLMTGTLPFEGSNSMEILTKHVMELPVPPRKRRPEVDISPQMESLILRALSKDPGERPQTAESFRSELLELEKNAKPETRPVVTATISNSGATLWETLKGWFPGKR